MSNSKSNKSSAFSQKLYVVEMLDPIEDSNGRMYGGWLPCESASSLTRREGRIDAGVWRAAFPEFKIRLAVYEMKNVAK